MMMKKKKNDKDTGERQWRIGERKELEEEKSEIEVRDRRAKTEVKREERCRKEEKKRNKKIREGNRRGKWERKVV